MMPGPGGEVLPQTWSAELETVSSFAVRLNIGLVAAVNDGARSRAMDSGEQAAQR